MIYNAFILAYALSLVTILIITEIWCWKEEILHSISNQIKDFFYYNIYIMLHWFFDIKFQIRLLNCCISKELDGYNLLNILTFNFIPTAIFIILIYGIYSNYPINFLGIICIPWAIFVLIIIFLTIQYYKKSEAYANGAQNGKYSSNKPHHGIFFVQYQNPRRQLFIADSIDLLVKILGENLPYKVYPIINEEDFKKAYDNSNIRWLWIFGHGEKRHLAYVENNEMKYIEYSNYPQKSNLLFIAQLHCNPGSGKSLPEVNMLTPDYDIRHVRLPFQNRCYIKKKAKEFIDQGSNV
jgi:hypothetical protein